MQRDIDTNVIEYKNDQLNKIFSRTRNEMRLLI
jgi:hypothetical protein